ADHQVSTDTLGQIRVLPPETAEEILAREKERKARTTLLIAIPEDHLAKFYKMTDAKKMFQSLLSKLEIHGAGVSTEDANQKFLRSLPSFGSQVSLIVKTKPGVDTLRFDDLYNNLRVFEYDVKGSLSYIDELMYFFFDNQSIGLKLDHEDLEQLDEFDLEEMDLKWQVAMISMRLKKFYKKTRRKLHFDAKEPIGFDKNKVECFNCHNTGHFARECKSKGNQESRRRDAGNIGYKARENGRRPAKQDEPKAMVTIDREGVDWTGHAETDIEDYALMPFNSSNSGSDIEKLLAEAEKEKEELKTKLKNFQSSSKGLSKLLNSQMSAKDKFGLGYETQIHEGVLSYKNEVLQSVVDSRPSDVEDSPVNDRFAKVERMHAVPPPMTGIYMPPKSNFGINESKFTYDLKQSNNSSELDAKTNDLASCESNSSVETLKSVLKLIESKPKVVSEPKVWSDAPIIEEYKSDSDDEYVSKSAVEQETPSYAFINHVKHEKTPRQTVKDQDTCSLNPKIDKRE
nr:ribonuclease H-like domain-containing protein [Tanacetum cinerariifolium]